MIIIDTNIKGVLGRFIMLILLITLFYLIIQYGIANGQIADGKWILYIILLLFAYAILGLCLSFWGIIKVQIDNASGQITFIKLFSKRELSRKDINGYYNSVYVTTKGTSYGRIIKIENNILIELNPGNLNDLDKIDKYFNELKIIYLGEKRSFYPFTRGL